MATLTIKDLPTDRALDRQAMVVLRGGNAGWVYGWIRAFVERPASPIAQPFAPVVNFYQTNNFFTAAQMNNQIVAIDVQNSGNNSVITVAPNQIGINAVA
jgi:hypothetical protein